MRSSILTSLTAAIVGRYMPGMGVTYVADNVPHPSKQKLDEDRKLQTKCDAERVAKAVAKRARKSAQKEAQS